MKIKDSVLDIVSKIAKLSIDELRDKVEEKGVWDSIAHVEIILILEEEFNIIFDQKDIAEVVTPQLMVGMVLKKVNEG